MKKIKGMKYYFIPAAIALLIVAVAVPVGATGKGNNDRRLFGEYAVNWSQNCASCTQKFLTAYSSPWVSNMPICPATPGWATLNVQGVYTFDGRGGFEFVGKYLAVLGAPMPVPNFPGLTVPVVLSTLECLDGIYTVNDDLTVAAGFKECTASLANGDVAHVIKDVNMRGQLLDRMDGPVLLLSDTLDPVTKTTANMETLTNPLTTQIDSYRICGITGTAIKIKGYR